jgi:predicted nucleic acid-binding protein
MTPLIIDASVAIKWFIPEPQFEMAIPLQHVGDILHAPLWLDVELTAIV